ncbi:hypothetical protein SEA_BARB_37 [Gordonia phage Barb]|uniref:LtfC/p132/Gp6 beta-sandwich domain-containing protein n=3 Tax=Wizardvirus TaxID=2169658 RepID=A0A4Y5U0B9_9CAUD|nr:hypothetical protein KNU54_gp38 [Gordonia phage VanDeWege]YP_010102190.1 hypothetical protein KNU55_gp37 [Gordonia phage Barb]YP_010102289.1 hypothetical protein KNU56_gp38 [Gordonia phage Arri]QXO14415.1 hypothetical protein SEA_FUGAX_37 [Gordonia phage Fugax]QZD98784.1 hypothetical protein SEA_PINKCOFFEE_37 [Gordonia phage PinkCoffee]WNM73151.1 hypothetical protein SEA_CLAMCHOWDER_37 [Gordonia phage ClamChowder]QDB74620.1 hypothetical protein SEA_VANDEWEGE_38 [Gordonia phage VanDeWege]Q
MADWAPEIAKRDFTIRDGSDYDLSGTFRDPKTKEPWPPPEGSTAYFRVGQEGDFPHIPVVLDGANFSGHIEKTDTPEWPARATFRLYVVLPNTVNGFPQVVSEGVIKRADAKSS